MAGINLDISKAHKYREIDGLLIVYTWVNDQRAMVLLPAYRQNAPWYILQESAAYKYDDDDYLKAQSIVAADVLGMRPVPNNWVKIASIIIEGLPDLIEMPTGPEAEQYKTSFGKVALRANGEIVSETDIKVDKQGVLYA